MLSPSPPRRRLVAARRLGHVAGLAAMLTPSPPSHRLIAAAALHHVDCTNHRVCSALSDR
eukprot:5727142-Pyramimonas_sp.AAC.1